MQNEAAKTDSLRALRINGLLMELCDGDMPANRLNAGAQDSEVGVAGEGNLRIAVIVASMNRPEEIGQLLKELGRQTLKPAAVILSVTKAGDLPDGVDAGVTVILGDKGLTRQRNRGLDAAQGRVDVAVFYDDDYLPAANALAGISALFQSDPSIVGATGLVLRDGIKSGGLDYAASIDCLDAFARLAPESGVEIADFDELYGCNMAVRMSALDSIRFDEALPLYGWQEDVDFAGQLLRRGRIVKTNCFAGVHRGVVKGRSSGVPLGVSQILNPLYMVKKKTMRPMKAAQLIARNVAANHLRALRPESYVDRMGRARGNWLGAWYILTGKTNPEIILSLIPTVKGTDHVSKQGQGGFAPLDPPAKAQPLQSAPGQGREGPDRGVETTGG